MLENVHVWAKIQQDLKSAVAQQSPKSMTIADSDAFTSEYSFLPCLVEEFDTEVFLDFPAKSSAKSSNFEGLVLACITCTAGVQQVYSRCTAGVQLFRSHAENQGDVCLGRTQKIRGTYV